MSPLSGSDPNMLRRVATEIRKKMDLEASLNLAQRRQRVMLPSPPDIPGYEFASTYDPAADISGDFYDFVHVGAGRVGILQGDVSGHGVEAAIVMGMAKKALSIFARSSNSAREALCLGNDDLCPDLDSETFMTVVYALLDAGQHRMTLARAGHTLPVLLNPKRKPPHQVLKSGGMMLGMYPGEPFAKSVNEIDVDLVAGDLVFFYTDGLTETRSPSGEQFGLDRVLSFLEAHYREKLPAALESLRSEVTQFRGGREPEDDLTMIAIRRLK